MRRTFVVRAVSVCLPTSAQARWTSLLWLLCVSVHLPVTAEARPVRMDHPLVHWVQPEKYQAFSPISFRLHHLPKQEFMLIFPEGLTARVPQMRVPRLDWTLQEDVAIGHGKTEDYALTVTVIATVHGLGNRDMALRWQYVFHNHSSMPVVDLAAFHCLLLDGAPLFKDLTLERTWVQNGSHEYVPLHTITKTQGAGKRTMQFYPSAQGIDLAGIPGIAQWGVTAPEPLSGDRMMVVSQDGRWRVESIVEGPVAFFFNNWEDDHGCIHVAPLFGTVPPGDQRLTRGTITFRWLL